MLPKTKDETIFEERREFSWLQPTQDTTESVPGVLNP